MIGSTLIFKFVPCVLFAIVSFIVRISGEWAFQHLQVVKQMPVINDVKRSDIFRDMRRSKEQLTEIVGCAAKAIIENLKIDSELL